MSETNLLDIKIYLLKDTDINYIHQFGGVRTHKSDEKPFT